MSEEPIQRPPAAPESENTLWKWIAGGVAAFVLLGGGYALWSNSQNRPDEMQTAYSADGPADPFAADSANSDGAEDTVAAPASESNVSTAPAPRRAIARAEPTEEIIGVTPASVTTTSDSDEIVVTAPRRPVWVRTPSERRLTALYPARALERGREGEASLSCVVRNGGDLDCARVSETPTSAGFGHAAMRVARTLQHAPQRADGADAAGTRVNLRVVFRLEDEPRRRRA